MALVAYYPLDGDANDYSGNKNHGVLGGGAFVEGKINQAYCSSINTDRINVSTNNLIPVFSETFSVSFWYKMDSRDSIEKFLVSFGSSAADSLLHIVVRTNNKLAFAYYANDFNTTYDVPENQWVHIVCVGNKKEMKQKVYINGEFFAERSTNTWLNPATENLVLGNRTTGSPAKGIIDEVRIYNHALSEFEIRELALFHPSANLVAHYPLDGDVIDYSGNNFHLNQYGTFSGFENGKIKEALIFNGANFYLDNDNVTTKLHNKSVTFSYWLKFTSTANLHTIALNTSSGGNNILLGIISGKHNAFNMGAHFESVTSINDGEWHHIGVVFNGIKAIQYIDGVFDSEKATTAIPNETDRFAIGQEWDGNTPSQFYLGSMDEVRVYNRELSESEIKVLAQAKVAHYKLSDKTSEPVKNLLTNNKIHTWRGSSKVEKIDSIEYGGKVSNYNKGTTLDWNRLESENITDFVTGDILTLSFDYISHVGQVGVGFREYRTDGQSGYGSTTFLANTSYKKTRYSGSYQIQADTDYLRIWIYTYNRDYNFAYEQEISIKNIMVEKNSSNLTFTKNIREGAIVKDSTYNNNHGSVTLANSPKWSSDTATGYGSMEFDGVSTVGIMIDPITFTTTDDFTVSYWFKSNRSTYFGILQNKDDYNIGRIAYDAVSRIRIWNPVHNISLSEPFKANVWNHFTLKQNTSGTKVFKNGILIGSSTTRINQIFNMIGGKSSNSGWAPYDGKVADIQIFATALSDDDIYNLYTSKSKSIQFNSSATSKIKILKKTTGDLVPSGGSHSGGFGLIFSSANDCTLEDTLVRPYYTGNLQVLLYDFTTKQLLYSSEVQPVVNGVQRRISLNFPIQSGRTYWMGRSLADTSPLMRTNTKTMGYTINGFTFPNGNTLAGGSPASRYYYFFDIHIKNSKITGKITK